LKSRRLASHIATSATSTPLTTPMAIVPSDGAKTKTRGRPSRRPHSGERVQHALRVERGEQCAGERADEREHEAFAQEQARTFFTGQPTASSSPASAARCSMVNVNSSP